MPASCVPQATGVLPLTAAKVMATTLSGGGESSPPPQALSRAAPMRPVAARRD